MKKVIFFIADITLIIDIQCGLYDNSCTPQSDYSACWNFPRQFFSYLPERAFSYANSWEIKVLLPLGAKLRLRLCVLLQARFHSQPQCFVLYSYADLKFQLVYLESALPDEAKREFAARKTLSQSTPAPLPQVHPPPHVQFQFQKPSRADLRRERALAAANAPAAASAHTLSQAAAEEQPQQEELQTLNDRQNARGPQAAQRAEEEVQLVVPRVPLTAENLLQMGGRLFLAEPDRVLVANDGSTPREVTAWRVLDAGESAAMVRTLLSRLNDARAALAASAAAAQTQSSTERERLDAESSSRQDGGAGGTFLHRQPHVHDNSGALTRLPHTRPASTPPEQPEQYTQQQQHVFSPSVAVASSHVRVRDRRVASSADFGDSSPRNEGTGPLVTGLIVVNGKPVDREWLLGPGGSSRDPRHARGCA